MMIEKISMYLVEKLQDDDYMDQDAKDVLQFGVQKLIEDISKYILILTFCFFIGWLKEALLVILFSACYKTFVGGAHADDNIKCLIYSTIYLLLPVFFAKYIDMHIYIIYGLYISNFIFSLYVIYKHAPADTEEVPIINKEKRRLLKVCGFISLIIIHASIFIFEMDMEVIKILIITLISINIFTLDFAYKLLNCKRGIWSKEYKDLY